MNLRFRCKECGRLTEKFISTLEGPEGIFDGMIHYCHFCDLGFYILPSSKIEFVEIEKPKGMLNKVSYKNTEIQILK